MLSTTPDWVRTLSISFISSICAGGLVAGICVLLLTNPQCENGVCPPGFQGPAEDMADDAGGEGAASSKADPLTIPPPSPSKLSEYSLAAVAVDSAPCSTIGKNILAEEGTAVDAAIATLFCNGVVNSQSMGIGGGFLMTISLANGTRISVIAREMAPGATTQNLYKENNASSTKGAMAAGVPGEIMGAWEAKQRLGNPKVKWSTLLAPSIKLCQDGIPVNAHAARSMSKKSKDIKKDPVLSSVFLNPGTGEVHKEGDTYKHPCLAATLQTLADQGASAFYSGELGESVVKDIKEAGGIITMQDLKNYRVSWETPVSTRIEGTPYTVLSSPPPGSGSIMSSILGMVSTFKPTPRDVHNPLLWHRFTEACKYAYAKRTRLGDWHQQEIRDDVTKIVNNLTNWEHLADLGNQISDNQTYNSYQHYGAEFYQVEDSGTAHISVVSPAGDAVSVTSTINLLYGSMFMSPSTGIILNNQMDDFSFPGVVNQFGFRPSPLNFAAPGKRPMSSMSPSIVLDEEDRVIAVVGASGGSKIISAVAQVLLRLLFLDADAKTAVDARRIYHQLLPNQIKYEHGLTKWMVKGLKKFGHKVVQMPLGGAVVQAIYVDKQGKITANADFRKEGTTDGF